MSKKQSTRVQNKRPTIGVLVDSMVSGYQIDLWRGIREAAQKRDVNLLCFVGREIESTVGYRRYANAIYDLVSENCVDGLILFTGTLGHFIDHQSLEDYFHRYRPLPIVSIATKLKDVPSILLDNQLGTSLVVSHLIEEHGYQKIAFARTTEGHPEGDERFEAYKATLIHHDLPFDPDLVIPGEYYDHPVEAIQWLLDEKKAKPDAIVVVDDYMALPMLEELHARGWNIPEDMAIVGFDDVEETRYVTPPLTTMRQPLSEQGDRAIDLVLSLLKGEDVPQEVVLSPELIIRQSCGCIQRGVIQAGTAPISVSDPANWDQHRPQLANEIHQIVFSTSKESIIDLLNSFMDALENQNPETFLRNLDRTLRKDAAEGSDLRAWHTAITVMRQQMLPILEDPNQAENLIQQARVMAADATQRVQAHRRLHTESLAIAFRNMSQSINTTTDYDSLMDVIATQLPGLGIVDCFISQYEDQKPAADRRRLVLALNKDGIAELPQGGLPYPKDRLLPEEYLQGDQRYTLMVEPLFFRDEQFGFALFGTTSEDETIYDALAEQISSALKGASLVQQVERRALQLQTASDISQAASSILDPEELIQQSVELVHDRFNLYYAGLFMVDDTGKWAVLRAGTGEPGKRMIAESWKLEIGGQSMIGRCISNGQADIQLDVDKAPIYLRNPYLPETRSEMALPLLSRGKTIGALTIQSTLPNAFTEEDSITLQTMAGQLANAITNARLYNSLAREQYFMQALMNNIPDSIYFKDRQSRFLRATHSLARSFGDYQPKDLLGKTDFDFFTAEHAQQAFDDEQRIIETSEPLLGIEERETRPDREDTWVLTSKLPLRDESGEIIGTMGISRDITQQKLAEIALARRSNQLAAAAEIARAASSILDPKLLIQEAVELVRERFGLYYAGIFLVDETGEWAVLQTGTGRAGFEMLSENWKLEVGGSSMIGRCITSRKPDIQLNVDEAPTHLRNPYLPDTQSEMALPLISRGEVIGAMTIQSTLPEAFTAEDTVTLETLTGQLATSLTNARLLEQTRQTLDELQRIQRRYQIQAWKEYNIRREIKGYQSSEGQITPIKEEALPEIQKVVSEGHRLISQAGEKSDRAQLTIPIMLRDQPIGTFGLKSKSGKRKWSEDEIGFIENITEQFALAAESLRLLDETQRNVARERLVADITTKLRSTNDPQAMMQTAVSELRQALQAQRAQVLIANELADKPNITDDTPKDAIKSDQPLEDAQQG
jgi:PAS domain S-box-containing protein